MAINELYARQVQRQTDKYANWLPNRPLEVGHYGTLSGALFEPFGRLEGLLTETSVSSADIDFTINATRTISTSQKAAGNAGISKGKALLEIGFSKEAGTSFSLIGTMVERAQDLVALGQLLINKIDTEDFDKNHVIVVEVVHAAKATIICSERAGAEVKFAVDANTPINPSVMAHLSSKSSLVAEKGVGFKIISEGPIHPLFGLASIKSPLWGDREIVMRAEVQQTEVPRRIAISDYHYLEFSPVSIGEESS